MKKICIVTDLKQCYSTGGPPKFSHFDQNRVCIYFCKYQPYHLQNHKKQPNESFLTNIKALKEINKKSINLFALVKGYLLIVLPTLKTTDLTNCMSTLISDKIKYNVSNFN